MKTLVMTLLAVVLLCSCKKDAEAVLPGGHVPAKAAGKWMYGSFAMSDFWAYDGSYQGKPFELAVVFDFKSDGTYEKYFVATTRDYSGCKTEAFTFEKGSVDFSETDGSFTTTPTEGHYRGFYSCFPKQNVNRKMNRSELKTQTYHYELKTGSNGKPNLVVRFQESDSNVSTFLPTSW
ncbi:hypothetical protein [Larkinella punicea]|uniref:Lipocalin-like domain-containing protein n=1 Tax=Larkinella punicea TaxID=2315727 RepID=A0A368JMK8_9BACT|nr:hypothetical protein [Larkinella punicea]RCR67803.1 hypothetical protein DUE52_20000 [Larkinella punicea]